MEGIIVQDHNDIIEKLIWHLLFAIWHHNNLLLMCVFVVEKQMCKAVWV